MTHPLLSKALVVPVLLAFAVPAMAQEPQLPMIEDTDGTGDWSMTELQQIWPDLQPEGFASMDIDGNGAVDAAELSNALSNGVVSLPGDTAE